MGRFSEDIIKLFEIFKGKIEDYQDLNLEDVEFEYIKLKSLLTDDKPCNNESIDETSKIPFIPMELIPENGIYFSNFILKGKNEISTSAKKVYKGDFLLAKITPSFENGKQGILVNIPTCFAYTTTEVYRLRFKDEIFNKYIAYFFLNPDVRSYLANRMEGATGRKRIPSQVIYSLLIPIPKSTGNYTSYQIQKAIADFIEFVSLKSDDVISLMEEMIEKAEKGKENLLCKIFENLPSGEISDDVVNLFNEFKEVEGYQDLDLEDLEFEEKELKDISEELLGGFAYGKTTTSGIMHLRPNNISENGKLVFDKVKFVPEKLRNEKEQYFLKEGDILFNNTNSIDLVGKTCYIDKDLDAFFSNHMTRIRLKSEYNPLYISLYLQSLFLQGYFKNVATRWVNQAGISLDKLGEVKIFIPKSTTNYTSYQIQKIIAEFIEFVYDKFDNIKENAKEEIIKANKLKILILKKVFL